MYCAMRNAIKLGIYLILLGCLRGAWLYTSKEEARKEEENERTRNKITTITIGQRRFRIQESALIEEIKIPEQSFGLLTDTHGDVADVQYFTKEFIKRKVDGVILTGDIADMFRWYVTDDGEHVLRVLGETNLPVYVLPGNHDVHRYYTNTIRKLGREYPNIIDLLRYRRVDAAGINFVSNPYGEGPHYKYSDYVADERKYDELEKLLCSFSDNDPVVLVTHQPPLCKGKYGVDYTLGEKNEGSQQLAHLMKKCNVKFSFSGHLHSATNGCTETYEPVPQKQFSPSLLVTPGAVLRHKTRTGYACNAAIITVTGKTLMYELLERD